MTAIRPQQFTGGLMQAGRARTQRVRGRGVAGLRRPRFQQRCRRRQPGVLSQLWRHCLADRPLQCSIHPNQRRIGLPVDQDQARLIERDQRYARALSQLCAGVLPPTI